jgi:hypothetical protein
MTVLILGLVARFTDGILGAEFDIFANWWIIGIAAVLTVIEFLADKIPAIDNIWDTVHSFIRTPGGMVLAGIIASGSDPVWVVAAVLVGGVVSFTAHGTKSSFRAATTQAAAGHGNMAVSVAEDLFTFGGALLAVFAPTVLAGIVIAFMVALVFFGPKIVRSLRINTTTYFYALRNLYYVVRRWIDDDFEPKRKPVKLPAAIDNLTELYSPQHVARVVIGKPFRRRMGWLLVWDDHLAIVKQNVFSKPRRVYYFDELAAASLKKGWLQDRVKLVTEDAMNIHISLFKGKAPNADEIYRVINEQLRYTRTIEPAKAKRGETVYSPDYEGRYI